MTEAKKPPETTDRSRVLIIDDDKGMSYTLTRMVHETGHSASAAYTIYDGLSLVRNEDFDVVFLDVILPDGSGLDIIPKIQAMPFSPEIIIITAFGEKNGAAKALKSGVWDYIEKPARIDTMKLSLQRALQYRSQKKALKAPVTIDRTGIIGNSPKMQMCITLLAHAARSDVDVLIRGETGTGKELFARAIHNNSARNGQSFVVVDCTSLPRNLAESILFGHTKGAFTGADHPKEGLVKQAHGGTLFLDEVGELPLDLQKTFLRVLQERLYRPIGGEKEVKSNFRLVSATNRDLEGKVEAGRFRQDLMFRLGAFVIELPALMDRTKDIEEISRYYVERLCGKYGLEPKTLSEEVLDMLQQHDWPGNVRELVSTLERAVAMEPSSPVLYPKHLPDHIRAGILHFSSKDRISGSGNGQYDVESGRRLAQWKIYRQQAQKSIEKRYLEKLMACAGEDIQSACEISGLKRARLYQLLKKYSIGKSN